MRAAGAGVPALARGLLRARGGALELAPRRAVLCEAWKGEEKLDDVVAVFYPVDSSPVGEPLLELTCHGSPAVLEGLLAAALSLGARLAEPGEFTRRAFLNGKLDLAQAEAVAALIRARTDAARRVALRQLDGGLSKEVRRLREPVFELLVQLEARLDHPEEDLPALPEAEVSSALAACAGSVRAFASTFARGRLLTEGARVCIVGRPNAGKSSLLNALLGRERAIVCAEPGTTRDTLEEAADLGGLSAVLVDTAGLRERCSDAAERAGVARAEAALEQSDLALLVVDGSRPVEPEDAEVHRRIGALAAKGARPVITILNKSDLARRAELAADISVSALRGEGLDALLKTIAERLGAEEGQPPALVASLRHERALSRAADELDAARQTLAAHPGRWEDRAAFHLREALSRLGEITGEGAPDEVLRAVFSRFCVGK